MARTGCANELAACFASAFAHTTTALSHIGAAVICAEGDFPFGNVRDAFSFADASRTAAYRCREAPYCGYRLVSSFFYRSRCMRCRTGETRHWIQRQAIFSTSAGCFWLTPHPAFVSASGRALRAASMDLANLANMRNASLTGCLSFGPVDAPFFCRPSDR